MPETIIKVDNISKSFGKNQVLREISLEIKQGEIYGIVGMSGSGKSTMLSIISDLIKPDRGKITYRLKDNFFSISDKTKQIKELFGYAFQTPSFHPMLTVEENIEHFSILYGLSKKMGKENSEILLKLVELQNARKTLGKELSGGMQKRLGFACALVHSPKILFLDEPTSNLDPVLRKETLDVLKKINENGTTIVIASQLLTELDDFCDRLCIINNGKIVKEGPVRKLKQDYSQNLEIHLKSEPGDYRKIISAIKAEKLPVSKIINEGDKILLYTKQGELAMIKLIRLLNKLKENPVYLNLEMPPLAEIFESVIRK